MSTPLAAVFLAAVSLASRAGLEPGPHAVGFRILQARDLSRPSLSPGGAAGREIPIGLWYPAAGTGAGRALKYSDAVDRLVADLDPATAPASSAERRAAARRLFEDLLVEHGGDRARLPETLPAIQALTLAARAGAEPARGQHPLVLFPGYRPFAVQNALSEHLVSHGFVVAAIPMRGRDRLDPEISLAGLETMVADLAFALAEARRLPFVSRGPAAAMGVGFNATTALALAARDRGIGALVSLDGGITTAGERRLFRRSAFSDPADVRLPILAMCSAHPDVDPARLDAYRYSDRRILTFPGMREFDFLDYGVLEAVSPGIAGKPAGDSAAGFAWSARYTLAFLRAALTGDAAAAGWLDRPPAAVGAPAGLFAVSRKPALPTPPALGEWKAILERSDGAAAFEVRYRELSAKDPEPVAASRFGELTSWVGWNRDADGSRRRTLARLRVAAFPESARAHFAAMLALPAPEAEDHAREALRLVACDPDPELDADVRARIETEARKRLTPAPG